MTSPVVDGQRTTGAPLAASERGASLAEYALAIGLLAVLLAGALTKLGSRSSNELSAAGTGIHAGGQGGSTGGGGGGVGGPGGTGGSGGTGGTGGTGGIGGPATTVAPTTAPATTVPATTVPPTTAPPSTAPPTTEAPAAASISGSAQNVSGSRWRASASIAVDGAPAGAVATVQVRTYRPSTGSWSTETVTVTLDSSGRADLSTSQLRRSGGSRVSQVQFVVVSVQMPGGGSWNGEPTSVVVQQP